MRLDLSKFWVFLRDLSPLALAIIVLGLFFQVFAFVSTKNEPPPRTPSIPEAFIRYPGQGGDLTGALVEERALLYDSEPLFLPTVLNWKGGEVPRYTGEPISETLFASFEPQLQLSENSFQAIKLSAKSVNAGVPTVYDMLDWDYWGLFSGFAHDGQAATKQVPERVGFLRVVELATGKPVVSSPISIDDIPEALVPTVLERQEYLILITNTGLSGRPLSLSTREPEEAPFWLNKRVLEWVEQLDPGYYRLQLGP